MTPVTDPEVLSQLNAPQPVTDPAILAQLNNDAPQSTNPGFFANVGSDWNSRMNTNVPAIMLADQSTPETALQIAGQGAGAIGDVIGEGVKSATPQWLTNLSHSLAGSLDNTAPGQAIGNALLGGSNAVSTAENNYPRAARNVAAIANLTSLGAGADGGASVEGAGANLGLGDALYDSGKAAQDASHQEFVNNLILPKQTPTVKADMATRTTQINGTNVYVPSPQEQQVAATIATIPGVNQGNSMVKNLNAIQQANQQEAEALKSRLQAANVPISDDTIQNALLGIKDNLAKSTNISGPGEAITSRVLNAGLDHIAAQPQTAAGMLEARKAFDNQMIKEKGEGILDPAVESPRSNAVASVRQAMNGMVANAVPDADVLTSLQKQSNMFNAIDNIAPKAANEAPTALGRMVQAFTPSSMAEGAKGVGALFAAKEILPHVPPAVLGAALAGYGMYKGAASPVTRIALGKALGVSNP